MMPLSKQSPNGTPNTMQLLQMQREQHQQREQSRDDPPSAEGVTQEQLMRSIASSHIKLSHADFDKSNHLRTKKTSSSKKTGKAEDRDKKKNKKKETAGNKIDGKRGKASSKSVELHSITRMPPPLPGLPILSDHSQLDGYATKPISDSDFTASTVPMTDSERSEEDHPRVTPVLVAAVNTGSTTAADDKSAKTQKTKNTSDAAASSKARKSKPSPSNNVDDSVHTAASSSTAGNNDVGGKEKTFKPYSSSGMPTSKHLDKPSPHKKKERTTKSLRTALTVEKGTEAGMATKAGLNLSSKQIKARLGAIEKLERHLLQERRSLAEDGKSVALESGLFEFFLKEAVHRIHELTAQVKELELSVIDAGQREQAALAQAAAIQQEVEKSRAKLKIVKVQASQLKRELGKLRMRPYAEELKEQNQVLKQAHDEIRQELDEQRKEWAKKQKKLDRSGHDGLTASLLESPKGEQVSGLYGRTEVDLVTPTGANDVNTELTRLLTSKRPKKLSKKMKVTRDDLDPDILKPPLVEI